YILFRHFSNDDKVGLGSFNNGTGSSLPMVFVVGANNGSQIEAIRINNSGTISGSVVIPTMTGSTTFMSGSSLTLQSGSLIVSGGPFSLNSLGNITREGGIGTNLVTGSVTQINVKFGVPSDSDYITPSDGLL